MQINIGKNQNSARAIQFEASNLTLYLPFLFSFLSLLLSSPLPSSSLFTLHPFSSLFLLSYHHIVSYHHIIYYPLRTSLVLFSHLLSSHLLPSSLLPSPSLLSPSFSFPPLPSHSFSFPLLPSPLISFYPLPYYQKH